MVRVARVICCVLLLVLLGEGFLAHAQILIYPRGRSMYPRRQVRRTTGPPRPAQPPPKPAPVPVTNTVVVVTNPPPPVFVRSKVDPEKIDAEKKRILKNTVEWETSRAQAGATWAQYQLGVRYLSGDGVETNSVVARKWLQAAADNGDNNAKIKLRKLDDPQPSLPPPATDAAPESK